MENFHLLEFKNGALYLDNLKIRGLKEYRIYSSDAGLIELTIRLDAKLKQ